MRSAPRKRVVKRGGDTWFFLTADYAFGHSLERDATQVIVQNGGKLIGSVAHPFSTPDLSSFILQAQSSKAKIIGLASGPPDNVNAIKLGGKFGIFQGGQQMAGLLIEPLSQLASHPKKAHKSKDNLHLGGPHQGRRGCVWLHD